MMHRTPYYIQITESLAKGDMDSAHGIIPCAMQEIGDHLQAVLSGHYRCDLPFAVAAMEMAAESLRGTMSPTEQQFADRLKQLVVCATITLNRDELQKQVRDMEEDSGQ